MGFFQAGGDLRDESDRRRGKTGWSKTPPSHTALVRMLRRRQPRRRSRASLEKSAGGVGSAAYRTCRAQACRSGRFMASLSECHQRAGSSASMSFSGSTMLGPSRRRVILGSWWVSLTVNTPADRRLHNGGGASTGYELDARCRGSVAPCPPGCCTRMGGVEGRHWRRRSVRARIGSARISGDQCVVAERCAASRCRTRTFLLPDAGGILAATLAMSQGARNCPFLTLTTRFVCAAATRQIQSGGAQERGICRQHRRPWRLQVHCAAS